VPHQRCFITLRCDSTAACDVVSVRLLPGLVLSLSWAQLLVSDGVEVLRRSASTAAAGPSAVAASALLATAETVNAFAWVAQVRRSSVVRLRLLSV
jgi:hypothetical protein